MPEQSGKPAILFDGVCNLCNGVVRFVIARDPEAHFRFASLQSEIGWALLREHALSTTDWDTFVLIEGSTLYIRSDAILRIASGLAGPCPAIAALTAAARTRAMQS